MNELLLKIYENVISREEECLEMEKRMGEWISTLAEPYSEQLDAHKMERLKDFMYSTAIRAEQEGFQIGVKMTMKLILELLTDL